MTRDRMAWATTVVGAVLFVGLAWWLIPWHPVPGGPLHPPPQERFFTAEELAAADSFSHVARIWSRLSLALATLVPCAFGFTRRGQDLLARLPGRPWLRVLLVVLVVRVTAWAVTLPCEIALERAQRTRGLSTRSWGGFAQDQVVSTAISVVAATLLLWVLLGLVHRFPRGWPAIAGGVFAGLVVLGSWVYPVVVQPLFLHVSPMPDSPLRTQILALADREGVQVNDVEVADASRRTTTLNAYVLGFGSTRQIVVYDNLVRDVPRGELLVVVAHELGHARDEDVLHGTLIGAAAAVTGAGLVGLLVRRRLDTTAVPRLLAVAAVAGLVSLPVQNLMSRQVEARADVTALQTTHDQRAFIDVQVALAIGALQDPTPPVISQWLFGNHPTPMQRIALALRLSS